MEDKKEKLDDKKIYIRIGVTCAVVFLFIHYWDAYMKILGVIWKAALPLLAGCVIAYAVNIPMGFFEAHIMKNTGWPKLRRTLCMIMAYLAILLIIALAVGMVIPELVDCVQVLLDQAPGLLSTAYEWLDGHFQISTLFQEKSAAFSGTESEWRDVLEKVVDILVSGAGSIADTAVNVISSVVSNIVTLVMGLVFSLYLLYGKERVGGQITALMTAHLPEKVMNGVTYTIRTFDRSFHSYIVGQCIEAVILGILCMLGMLILRLPYAAMIGALVGVTALIPVAGAYIGGIVGALMILTVSPIKALIFIVFLIVLQQVEGNLIYPRIVGTSIGLPGIWVLAAVTVGGGVGGIGGMLAAVPLAAAVYRMLKDNVRRKKEKVRPAAAEEIPVRTGFDGEENGEKQD